MLVDYRFYLCCLVFHSGRDLVVTEFDSSQRLTTTYNLKANGNIKQDHSPIVKALAKACDGRVMNLSQMLQYVLWADHTRHSSVTGYMPGELMTRQALVMPTKTAIVTWIVVLWKEEMSREEILSVKGISVSAQVNP